MIKNPECLIIKSKCTISYFLNLGFTEINTYQCRTVSKSAGFNCYTIVGCTGKINSLKITAVGKSTVSNLYNTVWNINILYISIIEGLSTDYTQSS